MSQTLKNSTTTKTISVFINGQNRHYLCEINPKVTKTWSEVLHHLGNSIGPKLGCVKKLIALSSLRPVRDFKELNGREKYIVLNDREKFKQAPNGYKTSIEEKDEKKSGSFPFVRKKDIVAESTTTKINKSVENYSSSPSSTREIKSLAAPMPTEKGQINSNPILKTGSTNSPEKKQGQTKPNKDNKLSYINKQRLNDARKTAPTNVQTEMAAKRCHAKHHNAVCTRNSKTVLPQSQRKVKREAGDNSTLGHNITNNCVSTVKSAVCEETKDNKIQKQQKTPMETNSRYTTSNLNRQNSEKDEKWKSKDKFCTKPCVRKNIFHPSPTQSIKNIALVASDVGRRKSETILVPAYISQAVRSIENFVIPHEALSKRIRDLKAQVVACKHNVLEMNRQITSDGKKAKGSGDV